MRHRPLQWPVNIDQEPFCRQRWSLDFMYLGPLMGLLNFFIRTCVLGSFFLSFWVDDLFAVNGHTR